MSREEFVEAVQTYVKLHNRRLDLEDWADACEELAEWFTDQEAAARDDSDDADEDDEE